MQAQVNNDGDRYEYEPRTPLVKLGQGDYERVYFETEIDREPTGATAAYCLLAFVLMIGFIFGAAVGMWIGGAS